MQEISAMLVLMAAVLAPVMSARSEHMSWRLPEPFLLGAASAAYQIEGAWNKDGKGESIWDNLLHRQPNFTKDGSNGDVAADSYHQYRRDIALLKELGVDVYRFSIAWTRIMPNGDSGELNHKGIAHYNKIINLLLANGITPMVTMYHWDLPQRLQELGGWANPRMADYFQDYAHVLFYHFGDRVKWWVTINEPEHIVAGYEPAPSVYVPAVAPQLRGNVGVGAYLAAHTLQLAHAKAYHLYNSTFRRYQHGRLGIAFSCVDVQPATNTPEDIAAAERLFEWQIGLHAHAIYSPEGDYPRVIRERVDHLSRKEGRPRSRLPSFTQHELHMLKGSADYIGVNAYTSSLGKANESAGDVGASLQHNPAWPTSAAKWLQFVPSGMRKMLKKIAKEFPDYPIFITENGYADLGGLNDTDRVHYIVSYMSEMMKAMYLDKVNICGYTYWSLMDSYEWDDGYRMKFGLYAVDYEDPERRTYQKKSARVFAEIAKHRHLPQWVYKIQNIAYSFSL